MKTDFMKNYKLAENLLSKLYTSEGRAKILDILSKGPMNLADLARGVEMSPPNAAAKLKELEDLCLVEKDGGKYKLSRWGNVIKSKCNENAEVAAVFEKFKDFGGTHYWDGIPLDLLDKMGMLANSKIVTISPDNVNAPHESFVKLLNSIKEKFYGVSPIYQEEWMDIATYLINRGVDLKIVFTPNVVDNIVSYFKKHRVEDEIIKRFNCFLIDDEPYIAFTVSEKFLSMGLRSKHPGILYMDADLQSHDPNAVEWGMRLFEWYKKKAKPVKLGDYI